MIKQQVPKVLLIDIEMFPMEVYAWGIHDQNIPINMIKQRTTMASWAAKWLGKAQVFYDDVSKQKSIRNDKPISKSLQSLINQADIIVAHNLPFDKKKSEGRAMVNRLQPTKKLDGICTLKIAKKYFKLDSNKLESLAIELGLDIKKSKHGKFIGFDLWSECMNKNQAAWKEMKKYNKVDVLVLEQVYRRLIPWDNSLNFNVYHKDHASFCSACGHDKFKDNGFRYSNTGKFKRFKCKKCGKESQSKYNELSPKKRREMLK